MATERDDETALLQRYRELERVEPPRALDDAILAAAKRAVRERPRPARPGWRAWQVPVSLAAVLVLSVLVTVHVREQPPELEAPPAPAGVLGKQEAATAQAPSPGKAPAVQESRGRKQFVAPKRMDTAQPQSAGRRDEREAAVRLPSERKPSEIPSPAGELKMRAAPSLEQERSAAAPLAPPAPVRAPVAQSAMRESARAAPVGEPASAADQARSQEPAVEESPERWLARIAQLRHEGHHKEADESFRRFRRRHPDYVIPEVLREKVLPR